jgi:hypothetical protein
METTVADVLEKAAERLEAKGWVQCMDGPEDGPNCARGAIAWEALAMNREWSLAGDALHEYLCRGGSWNGVVSYNDEPGREKEQVIDALKGAAKDLRNDGNDTVLPVRNRIQTANSNPY